MKEIKLPKYIIRELIKASNHAQEVSVCIENFEKWVKENVDEEFDIETLRAMSYKIDEKFQTEALTDIEYGQEVDIKEIERVLNVWVQTTKKR